MQCKLLGFKEQLGATAPPLHQHQSLKVFSWNPEEEEEEGQEERGGVGRGGDKGDSSPTHLWATVVLTLQQGDVVTVHKGHHATGFTDGRVENTFTGFLVR